MIPAISATALGRRYRDQVALDDVSLTVEPGTVTGLLGRNGAGKTTLMRIVTGLEFPTSGAVEVFGQVPAENDAVLRRMVFVREEQAYPDIRVGQAVRVASWFYPNWDQELARQLLADFGLPPGRRIRKLSRGMRSAVGITIGLAARAELTLFDEPYAGLDAVARQLFYDRLLADFAGHPRTVVLSTHLIDEAADLLEHVVMLDHGQVVLDAPADDVRGTTVTVSGPATAVEEFVAGRPVWHRQRLGPRAAVTVTGPFDVAAPRPRPRGAPEPGTPVAAATAGLRRQSFRRGEGERMTALVNIARYHLADRLTYLVLPWGVMVFSFLVNLVIAAVVPPSPDGYFTGGLMTIYIFLLICGTLSMTRSLPFGLMLGVSRRSYYLGTALLVVLLGAVYAAGLTVLQAIERATSGWGLGVHFFRVPWIMDGPWYQTWLTSFVLLVLFFGYGMWYGLVYRRWNLPGLLAFIAAQILVGARRRGRGVAHPPLGRRRALLHHDHGPGTDRRARCGRRDDGARRAHHHPPGHHLTT